VRPGLDVEITARGARRRGPDHANGISRIAIPALEDRAPRCAMATRWCSSRPSWCRARRMRCRKSSRGRAFSGRRWFNLVVGSGSVGRPRPCWNIPMSRRSRSPARSRPGAKIAPGLRTVGADEGKIPVGDGRQESAGGARRRRPQWSRSKVAVNGAYFSTGQRCTASSRLIVTEGIHDRFVAAMTERP